MSNEPKPRRSRNRPPRSVANLLQARFFKSLCDPSRIAILIRLTQAGAPQTVSQVAACCPTNISVVSRHLAMLRDAGILESERRGKKVYYSVRLPELVATLRAMGDALEACCPPTNVTAEKGAS